MEIYSYFKKNNQKKNNITASVKKEYTEEDFKRIRTYHDKMCSLKNIDFIIDDITWNDLDMDRVFSEINRTYSTVGEEYLYHILRCPRKREEDLSEFDRIKTYFLKEDKIPEQASTEKEKISSDIFEIRKILKNIGKMSKYSLTESLYGCLDLPYENNSVHYIINALILISFCLIFYVPSWGVLSFFAMLAVGIISYFKYKARIDRYITSMIYVLVMLKASEKLCKLKINELNEELSQLQEINSKFKSFKRNTYVLSTALHTTENPIELLLDYARMIFHVDIIKFNSMLGIMKEHANDVERLRSVLGMIDAASAVSVFITDNQGAYCVPEFDSSSKRLIIEDAFHPLTNKRIFNSIDTENSVLITGSNASGKSTFLKMVAICAILAQTIKLVPARSYKGNFYRIYSSMALRDSIAKKESYFIVEIKSLKRIVDAAENKEKDNMPILCFIDEVLRGTNTVERIAASSEILKNLDANGVICFAATHDIELTYILEDIYSNYHFEEQFVSGDITFDHKIYPGRSYTQNAIKLLSVIGYDDKVVGAAKHRAEGFVAQGKWDKG